MWIDRFICLNWGNLPAHTFHFGPVTLLTGGSGAGKTTLADGIQTVMTATKRNLFRYNPGQDESTQGGRGGKVPRTLESYILGADDNLFARPDGLVTGYVAIGFTPSPGDNETSGFTAIVGARARINVADGAGRTLRAAMFDSKRLIVVEDHLLTEGDFILSRENRQLKVVQLDAVYDHLRTHYGTAVSDFGVNHKNYLSMLYGKLRGRKSTSSEQAERAARTFSRFMAYKQISSVNEFVRNEILEQTDMTAGIAHIRGLINEVNGLRRESERLSGNVQRLKDLLNWGEQIDNQWRRQEELYLVRAYKDEDAAERDIGGIDKELRRFAAEEKRLTQTIEDCRRREKDLDSQRQSLSRQIQQHQTAQERDKLNGLIEADIGNASQSMVAVNTALRAAGKNIEAVRQIRQARRRLREHEHLRTAFGQADSAARELDGFDATVIGKIAEELIRSKEPDVGLSRRLVEALSGIDDAQQMLKLAVLDDNGLSDRVGELYGRVTDSAAEVDAEESMLKAQIEDLEQRQQVRYPRLVDEALQAIHQTIPGCHPVVLCDVVEVRDHVWQAAIEGYLGANRFMLLVEPQYEARAIRAVRALNRHGANVAQAEKARKDLAASGELPPDSIVNLLEIKNPLARSYLGASYGRVVQVADADTLRMTARGLTQDGMGSSGYSMFSCHIDDENLVFGRSGRERQIKAKRQKLADLDVRRRDLKEVRDDLQGLRALLRQLDVKSLEPPAQQLLTAAQRIHERRGMLAQLDLSSVAELDAALAAVEVAYQAEKNAIGKAHDRQGEIRAKTAALHARLPQATETLESARTEATKLEDEFRGLSRVDAGLRLDEVFERLKQEAREPAMSHARIGDDLQVVEGAINNAKGKFINIIMTSYNPQAQEHERIELQPGVEIQQLRVWSDYYAYMETLSQVRRQHKRQTDVLLSRVTEELQRAQKDVQNAFTADFCEMIYRAVQGGKKTLDDLNSDLRKHRFSEEIYEFEPVFDPLYKSYFDFFEKVRSMEGLGEGRSLFEDTGLEPEHITVRDKLLGLLLGSDEEKSKQELARIADYRNYRHYDILRKTGHGEPSRLSTWGSGSGGQMETPHYVIRCAAAASAYRFDEGDTHLRVALLDETFEKMDERRAKEVMSMLSGTMKMQVIFALPSMRAGPFQPLITNKLVFSKVASPRGAGELKTVTLVDEQVVNQEATQRLFERHRQDVRAKAMQQFLEIDP